MVKKIAVVEDDPFIQKLYFRLFQRDDTQISIINNGNDAISHLKSDPPDVLILDYNLPGMNGIEVLSVMKCDERLKTLPVLVVTGSDDPNVKKICCEKGIHGFYQKPLPVLEFREKVLKILEQK